MVTSTSTIRRTSEHKLAALTNSIAIRLAKKNNDPIYDRYTKYRTLYKQNKKLLINKYGPKALVLAKEAVKRV